MLDFDINAIKTPYYVVDERLIEKNLKILQSVQQRADCKILLAQKAFSMYSIYPLIAKYLSGTTASGLFEAKLAHEEMKKENHVFSPYYSDDEFDEIVEICDCIVFNSFEQWNKFKNLAIGKVDKLGLRVNPQCSTQDHAIYDPCSEGSRLGITADKFDGQDLTGINGLHFHCLCEQNVDALEKTLVAFEKKFGKYIGKMQWVNFGGGHHITRVDYDVDRLVDIIKQFKAKYNVKVYLEPGEAVALDAGFLVTTVQTFVENGGSNAILDSSAACHMPDVLEMPYRPRIVGSGIANQKKYTYRLGGGTCLAGDVIGEYSFDNTLHEGDKLVFEDMAIYSMVKNNFFNGLNLPSIAKVDLNGNISIVKQFGYQDFKNKL